MAYQPTKPAAGDLLSQSQSDIQQNFADIKTLIDVNHETFGAANEGKHTQVTLPEQGADPATAANEIALYTKLSAITAETGLFWRKEGSGDVIEITEAVTASPGYTYLPSGIIMAWGTGSITVGNENSAVITFHTAFPNAVLSVHMTPYNQQTGAAQDYVLNAYTITTASFYANRNGSYTGTQANFYYLAIGY